MYQDRLKINIISIGLLITLNFFTTVKAGFFKITDYQYENSKNSHEIMLIEQEKYALVTLDFGNKTLSRLKSGDIVIIKGTANIVTQFSKQNGYYVLKVTHPRDRRQYPYG